MPRFRDIPEFPYGNYQVNVSWGYLEGWIEDHVQEYKLDIDPDFQRGHVWTRDQQIAYVEYILRGGRSGRDILCNCPGWHHGLIMEDYVLVDGKQRLTAVLDFLHDEIPAFGYLHRDYEDSLPGLTGPGFVWHVATLQTRAEVLEWYLAFNSGGSVHADAELARVRKLLAAERS